MNDWLRAEAEVKSSLMAGMRPPVMTRASA